MAGYTVTVKVDSTGVGHAFVSLSAADGRNFTVGFYPQTPLTPYDRGFVKDDSSSNPRGGEHISDWSSRPIEITEQQFNAMDAKIREIRLSTERPNIDGAQKYFFPDTNCTWFVREVLKAGGVKGFEGWNPNPLDLRRPVPGIYMFPFGKLVQLFDESTHAGSFRGRRAGWREIVTPIIIDLDGDGVETKSLADDVLFDHDGNGFYERTGWVGSDDGLLAWDRNGNGIIDDGSELFGNFTEIAGGNKAANGYEALTFLDSNANGKLDTADAAWGQLRVWKDADGNAFSSDGELVTLTAAGIQSIATNYANSSLIDPQGNEHRQVSTYTKSDGSTGTTTDVWYQRDIASTFAKTWLPTTAEIDSLPDLVGSGSVHSLHQAMARDSSGILKSLVQQFGATTAKVARQALLEQIIMRWVDVDSVDPNSRGEFVDARKLAVVEQFLGRTFIGQLGNNPTNVAGIKLHQVYDLIALSLYQQLMQQTHLENLVSLVTYEQDPVTSELIPNLVALTNELRSRQAQNPGQGRILIEEMSQVLARSGIDLGWRIHSESKNIVSGTVNQDNLQGTILADAIQGGDANDALSGGNGNDALFGQAGSDILRGDDGDDFLSGGDDVDTLYGGDGTDRLDGGASIDTLEGGAGSDTYVFRFGSGYDTINNYDTSSNKTDVVEISADLAPSDIKVSRQDINLFLDIKGTGDRLNILGYFENFTNSPYRLEQIKFGDGTIWDINTIRLMTSTGTAGNDRLRGFDGDDTIDGLAGNDIIEGDVGNDHLIGGTGDDNLTDFSGNNLLEGGDGNDQSTFQSRYESERGGF